MMNYIIAYLLLGVLILSIIYISSRMDKSKDAEDLRNIYDLIGRGPKSLKEKILDKLIAPVIAGMLAILFWPGVIIWVIKDRLLKRAYKNKTKSEPEIFKVKQEHLKAQVSIEDIEAMEIVTDPLNAVPEIPFGHLNSVWKSFKAKMQPEDEIWSFSALWISEWGTKDQRTGYVMVKSDRPDNFFITAIKYTD